MQHRNIKREIQNKTTEILENYMKKISKSKGYIKPKMQQPKFCIIKHLSHIKEKNKLFYYIQLQKKQPNKGKQKGKV